MQRLDIHKGVHVKNSGLLGWVIGLLTKVFLFIISYWRLCACAPTFVIAGEVPVADFFL